MTQSQPVCSVQGVPSQDIELLVEGKWAPIRDGFKPPPGWTGPHLLTPEDVADLYQRNGLEPPEPSWQIVFTHKVQSAWHLDEPDSDGGVQAAIFFPTLGELLNTPTRQIVRMMAMSLAGRAAHEALEWSTMDGKLVINPHGEDSEMNEITSYIRAYLGNGATGLEPPHGVYE